MLVHPRICEDVPTSSWDEEAADISDRLRRGIDVCGTTAVILRTVNRKVPHNYDKESTSAEVLAPRRHFDSVMLTDHWP